MAFYNWNIVIDIEMNVLYTIWEISKLAFLFTKLKEDWVLEAHNLRFCFVYFCYNVYFAWLHIILHYFTLIQFCNTRLQLECVGNIFLESKMLKIRCNVSFPFGFLSSNVLWCYKMYHKVDNVIRLFSGEFPDWGNLQLSLIYVVNKL